MSATGGHGGGKLTRLWSVLVALLVAVPALAAPRIVAIGDLHGDYAAWRAIARDAGLIDAQGKWSGGNTILVQTGDVPDRGADTLKIVDDLMRLQREAPRKQGRVVTLVGNHEAMNVTGDLRYVSPGEYAAFTTPRSAILREVVFTRNQGAIAAAYRKVEPDITGDAVKAKWLAATPLGQLEHQAAWGPGGRIGKWVAGNPAVVLIDRTLFVHGGIGPAYAEMPVDEINRRVAAALKARAMDQAAIINDPAGPLWYRGLVGPSPDDPTPPPPVAAQLDRLLAAQHADRIVIGHTPILSGIAILEGGRLVRIDTGISTSYKGIPSWLEIVGNVLTPHAVARPAGGR